MHEGLGFMRRIRQSLRSLPHIAFRLADIRKNSLYFMVAIFLSFAVLDVVNYWDIHPVDIVGGRVQFDAGLLFFAFFCMGEITGVFILRSERFHLIAVISGLIAAASLVAMLMVGQGMLLILFIAACAACAGALASAVFFAFIFFLNNTEKLITCAGITLFSTSSILLFPAYYSVGIYMISKAAGAIILALVVWLLVRGRLTRQEHQASAARKKAIPKGSYWLLFFASVFFILEGLGAANSGQLAAEDGRIVLLGVLGSVIGIAIILIMRILFSKSAWYMWNAYLLIATAGFLLCTFDYFGMKRAALFGSLLLGAGTAMGYTAIWYLAGVVAKKYRNLRFACMGMLTVALSAVIGRFLAVMLLQTGDAFMLAMTGTAVTVSLVFIFLVLSPFFYRFFCAGEWMADLPLADVRKESRTADKIMQKNQIKQTAKQEMPAAPIPFAEQLTPRESELARLIIDGFTLKQIAEMLSISYNTVLTHYRHIYEKLNVHNKVELVQRYFDSF